MSTGYTICGPRLTFKEWKCKILDTKPLNNRGIKVQNKVAPAVTVRCCYDCPTMSITFIGYPEVSGILVGSVEIKILIIKLRPKVKESFSIRSQ